MQLAVLASILLTIGLYLMKRQAERLPSLDGGWHLRAWLAFVRDPLWVFGVLLQVAGYGLYLTALRSVPLSVVHTALNAGVALFVALAVLGLGEKPHPIEWLGVLAVAVGLVALGLSTSPETDNAGTGHISTTVFAALATAAALAALLCTRRAVGLSVASGLMLGLAGVYAKQLAAAASVSEALQGLPFLLTLATNMIGFGLMQGALQTGKGVVVVPIFSTLSNLIPIIAGSLVYGESLPTDAHLATLRVLSVILALAGAAALGAAEGMAEAPMSRARKETVGKAT